MIETPSEILGHFADAAACDSFVKWRKAIKKPLTDRAALMIAKTLAAINAAGGDATEALDMAQERGWQTIKPEWYWRALDGQRIGGAARDTSANAGDKQVAFAAAAIRSPREDCF